MGAATDLYDAAAQLRDAAMAALATLDHGAPDVAYIYPGLTPAVECDSALIVNVPTISTMPSAQNTAPGDIGARPKNRINLPHLNVTVVRCYTPDSGFDPDELDRAARMVLADIWCLWNLLPKAADNGTLGDLFGTCTEVFFDPPAALEPEGTTVGWQITVRPWLPGYSNE